MAMGMFGLERRHVAVVGVLVGTSAALIAVWSAQAWRMKGGFVHALEAGEVQGYPLWLSAKQWTPADLATARVLKLPNNYGKEQALEQLLYTRGDDAVSNIQFAFQGTVVDTATGIRYTFGYTRRAPHLWRWQGVHPDSMDRYLELRLKLEVGVWSGGT